jgi:hypothetical protein
MEFFDTDLVAAIDACRESAVHSEKAIGHNFTWDMRIGAERGKSFEELITKPVARTPAGLCDAFRSYYTKHLEWDPDDLPCETFQSVNDTAGFDRLPDKRTVLVRMVHIKPKTFMDAGLTLEQVQRALALHRAAAANEASDVLANARGALTKFVDVWNDYNQRPPAFAGFADDVEVELGKPDWPDQLRRRFGIGHMTVPKGSPAIPVMLLKYTVGDVLKAAKKYRVAAAAIRVPTTLDSGLYNYFYPSPTPYPYGRTVHLDGDQAVRRLACEIVHLPVDINLAHIDRIGEIGETKPTSALSVLRDHHLDALRIDTDCEDFGEYMDRYAT